MQGVQYLDDRILNQIGCCFNTQYVFKSPRPLLVIELFLIH